MIGAIIGAAASIGSSILGGMSAAKKRRKQARALKQAEEENRAWFDRRYNEDPTQRASANYLLTKTAEAVKSANRNARGRQAVMGGTEDSITASKDANSKAISDTAARITAANDAEKDRIENQYMNNKASIRGQQMQYDAQSANNIASATQTALGAIGNLASGLDSPEDDMKGNNKSIKINNDLYGDNDLHETGHIKR